MAELIWSPRALKDIELIYEYIKQDTIEAARAFINELIVETLSINKDQIREKIFKSYRIIYRISNSKIELVTFLHHSRRLIKQEFK
jgi:toxin ParE1/3/4